MLLLDLFCCRGGAAMGYHRAGFDIVGVDIDPQPLYPFEFVQGDALEVAAQIMADRRVSAVHASPPCQFATMYRNRHNHVRADHQNLIPATRDLLHQFDVLWVMENVEGARKHLRNPARICGTGLGIPVRRHRYFESNWGVEGVPCDHGRFTERRFPGSSNRPNGRTVMNVGEYRVPLDVQREVMQMPWSDLKGISQAIPPAYTEFIGRQLVRVL